MKILYEEGVLNEDIHNELPEKIEWPKGLKYVGFDGKRHRIRKKKHSIEF